MESISVKRMSYRLVAELSIILSIIGIFVSGNNCLIAQSVEAPYLAENSESHHVVVLIDRSRSMVCPDANRRIGGARFCGGREQYLRSIFDSSLGRSLLEQIVFSTGQVNELAANRPLYNAAKGDLLSILGFGLTGSNRAEFNQLADFNDFFDERMSNKLLDISGSGGFVFQRDVPQTVFSRFWEDVDANSYAIFDKYFGFPSLASRISLDYLRKAGQSRSPEEVKSNRTFIIRIWDTDENRDENSLAASEMQNALSTGIRGVNDISSFYGNVSDAYSFKQLRVFNSGDLEIGVFEVVSIAREFIEIDNLLDCRDALDLSTDCADGAGITFDHSLEGYNASLELIPKVSDEYVIEKASFQFDIGNTSAEWDTTLAITSPVSFDLHLDEQPGDMARLKQQYWVHLNDSLYGAMVLPPVYDGLIREMGINFRDAAQVLGFIDLSRGFYAPFAALGIENQWRVATIYNILILILTLFLALFFVRSRRKDKSPQIREISWAGKE